MEETENVIISQIEFLIKTVYEGNYEINVDMDILSGDSIHIKQIRIRLLSETEKLKEIHSILEDYFSGCKIIITQEVDYNDK